MRRGVSIGFRLMRAIFTIVILALVLGYGAVLVFHLEPMTMLTGSMGTTIPPGSIVITQPTPPLSLRIGDVITFQKPSGQAGLDTHRLIRIKRTGGRTTYWTKGDANALPDPWVIEFLPGQQAHRVIYHLPHVGRMLLWARGPIWAFILAGAIALMLLSTVMKMIVAACATDDDQTTTNAATL